MKRWLCAAIAAVTTLYCTVAMARPLTLNEISESTCRVRCGASGTGTCIGETPDGQSYYILTNGHVVGNSNSGTVEFFKGGYVTSKLPAQVVWKQYRRGSDIDFALLTVSKSLFGDHPPRVIPLVPEGHQIQIGNYIAAVGCPSARWAQGWEGHIITGGMSRVMFVPAPVGGQSGSGVTVLVQGRDREWHTRVGAVLTWRITSGGIAQGGAIPISTLYDVMKNQHIPYMTPVSYREVSDTIIKEVGTTKATGLVALGSDGSLYEVTNVNGVNTISVPNGKSVKVITWDYENSGYYRRAPRTGSWGSGSGSCPPGSGSCPPGSSGSPPHRSSGSSPWSQRPPSEQPPAPGPGPGVPPYTQPNPYGTNPPSIGAPWPGEAPEEAPGEGEDLTPEEELLILAEKYALLEEEKAAMEEEILAAEQRRLDGVAAEEDAELGWFGRMKKKMNGFVGGALMAFGIGVLIFVWTRFVKPRVIKRVDSLQDYLEGKVSDKWGKESAGEARELMEGVEEALLGFADDFLEDTKARNQVAKSIAKGKPAERVTNGSSIKRQVNVSEILAAVREASREVGDDTVTTEVPKKVDEILNRVAADKKAAR